MGGEVRGEDLGGLLSCTITVWWKLFCPPESCWRHTIAAPGPASPVVWGPENFPPPAPLRQRVWAPPWLYQQTKWRCLCPTRLLIYRGRWGSQTLWFWGKRRRNRYRSQSQLLFHPHLIRRSKNNHGSRISSLSAAIFFSIIIDINTKLCFHVDCGGCRDCMAPQEGATSPKI